MFTRLRETFRIINYRAPSVPGPDAIIVDRRRDPRVPASGKVIAFLLECLVLMFVIGIVAGNLSAALVRLHVTKIGISVVTVAGALGALLAWILHGITNKVQQLLKQKLNLADRLAPYFGHKLDETFRTLRG